MSDVGKVNQSAVPDEVKKAQERSGKKKNKSSQKKSGASSGDGAPSHSSKSQDTKQSVSSEGAVISMGFGDKTNESSAAQKKSSGNPSKGAEKQEKGPKPKGESPPEKPTGAGSGEAALEKSKAQLKAERRAKQEAQRAAKETTKKVEGGAAAGAASRKSTLVSGAGASDHGQKKDAVCDKENAAGASTSGPEKRKKKKSPNATVQNLSEEEAWAQKEKDIFVKNPRIDNCVMNLGFQYFHHKIVGANARCLALLATLRQIIVKYKTPAEKEFSRDFEKNFLNPCISYINLCRPLSTSMGNAIKRLKYHISHVPSTMGDDQAIAHLQDVIDNFIQEDILKAAEAVALYADMKIDHGDVIMIYAASSLIGQVLKTAHKKEKRFRVIVVEGRPRTEGKSMLRYLVRCGIPCSYVYIGSASHAMNEATKVFLGASAMFAIGDMHSRAGNSMIAALAKANNIPVLVCCETYKFTDKVQLHVGDSNMQARGKDLLWLGGRPSVLVDHEGPKPRLLNLMYDVTQSRFITALVTELGMLPCTSVPVVLRRQEDLISEG